MRVTFDTREPENHPWAEYLPEGWTVERAALETGDIALTALPEGAVCERKTATDLSQCLTAGRGRFERELARSRYVGRFVVVCEGSLSDLLLAARGMSEASVIGTLAAWERRYCSFLFAGSVRLAAEFTWRFLRGQAVEVERAAKALEGAGRVCKVSEAHLKAARAKI